MEDLWGDFTSLGGSIRLLEVLLLFCSKLVAQRLSLLDGLVR